jgi:hypothetical protein
MHLTTYHYSLLSLLSEYLQSEKNFFLTPRKEIKMDRMGWQNLYSLASKHGVTTMALEMLQISEKADQLELEFIPENKPEANPEITNENPRSVKYGLIDIETNMPPADLLVKWRVDTQESEKIYNKEVEILKELLAFLKINEIEAFVISGVVSGQMYKHPSHRHYGDIDIFLGSDYNKGNKLLYKLGINVEEVNSKYSTFKFRGVTVRNHKCFLFNQFHNRLFTKQDKKIDKQLINFLENGSETVSIGDLEVKTPNPEFMLLYLTRHLVLHFLEYGIFLRQLCDIALLIDRKRDSIDFAKMEKIFKKIHILNIFSSFISICNEHLGLNLDLNLKEDKKLTDRVLNDMFFNKYRLIDKSNFKKMGALGRYTLRTRYLFSSKWKYDHIQRGLYLRMLPYKLLS